MRIMKFKMALAIFFSMFFGFQIFMLLYAAGVPVMHSAASGAGAAGVAGVAWPHLPIAGKAYISVMGITITKALQINMYLLLFKHTSTGFLHMINNTASAVELGSCILQEGIYSVRLMKRSLFQESDVDKVVRGIHQVAATAQEMQKTQEKLGADLEESMKWLEDKTSLCKKTLLLPYRNCLIANNSSSIIWVCEPLKLIANADCFKSNDRVMGIVYNIREKISDWLSKALRLRIGIAFEMHSTSYVEQELVDSWEPFKKALNFTSSFISNTCKAIIKLLPYIAVFELIFQPGYFIMKYNFGYIESTYEEKKSAIPEVKEIFKILYNSFFSTTIIIPTLIFVLDYYYANFINQINILIRNLDRFQGKIFIYNREPLGKGFKYMQQIFMETLERLESAIGLGRMAACARSVQPYIDTNFIIIFAIYKIATSYYMIKLKWLASSVCANYYPQRHKQRMRWLKGKQLYKDIVNDNKVAPDPTDETSNNRQNSASVTISKFLGFIAGLISLTKRTIGIQKPKSVVRKMLEDEPINGREFEHELLPRLDGNDPLPNDPSSSLPEGDLNTDNDKEFVDNEKSTTDKPINDEEFEPDLWPRLDVNDPLPNDPSSSLPEGDLNTDNDKEFVDNEKSTTDKPINDEEFEPELLPRLDGNDPLPNDTSSSLPESDKEITDAKTLPEIQDKKEKVHGVFCKAKNSVRDKIAQLKKKILQKDERSYSLQRLFRLRAV